MNCQHDSAGAHECQQKASVFVDSMECSGGWKMTTAATKPAYIAHPCRIYYLPAVPQTQRSNQSNHKPATAAAAKPAGGLQYH
jgi:hypothetical protein